MISNQCDTFNWCFSFVFSSSRSTIFSCNYVDEVKKQDVNKLSFISLWAQDILSDRTNLTCCIGSSKLVFLFLFQITFHSFDLFSFSAVNILLGAENLISNSRSKLYT